VATPQQNLSANLDLLRAVAVASVVLDHLAISAWNNYGFQNLGRFGGIVFLVHTSLVLMASLERMDLPACSNLALTLAFWTRRFFRIYPLAVLCVVIVAVFHVPDVPIPYHWIGVNAFLSNLALIQNLTSSPLILAPFWTLPLEVQMYLILPFVYFWVRGGRYRSIALWVFFVTLVCVFGGIAVMRPFSIMLFTPCFTGGILAYDLARKRRGFQLPVWIWPVGILFILATFRPYDAGPFSERYLQCWGLSLAVGLLYPFVAEARANWFYKGCHWVAEHSYGIYLSHAIVLWIVFSQMHAFSFWIRIPVLIAGVLGIPAILYVWFEKPLIQVGVRAANRVLNPSSADEVQLAVR